MTISIIAMIYKSTSYLKFTIDMLNKYGIYSKYKINKLIIGNDPTSSVINFLKKDCPIPYLIYHDKNPTDYYMNRVYRGWNFGGKNANGDIIIFLNSDFAYTPNWLDNLMSHYHDNQLPCSKLVESGKLPSGQHAISRNFGRTPSEFLIHEEEFISYSNSIIVYGGALNGGLFMPCVISKDIFIKSGGYPEGNVKLSNGSIQSGDDFYFKRLKKEYGLKHITALDQIVFHF